MVQELINKLDNQLSTAKQEVKQNKDRSKQFTVRFNGLLKRVKKLLEA